MNQNTRAKLPLYVDYKDTKYLSEFLTPHARITASRRSRVPASHQRKIKTAIKRARYMALLPYIAR
ncbi:MAG: 30S ribosomal protein S18 [Patescibacteria group bacterium]|nr:30S ribosomal protein S18 [Patescibacteria group bacterium]